MHENVHGLWAKYLLDPADPHGVQARMNRNVINPEWRQPGFVV
jgi:hypothetical protein